MKSFLILFLSLFCTLCLASGPAGYDVRFPVGSPAVLDTSSTSVTSSAWVQMVASTSYACSGVLLINTGSQPIKIGLGAAASEADYGVIFPQGVTAMVPVQIPAKSRISVRSMGSTQSSGLLELSCFQ